MNTSEDYTSVFVRYPNCFLFESWAGNILVGNILDQSLCGKYICVETIHVKTLEVQSRDWYEKKSFNNLTTPTVNHHDLPTKR